MSYGGGYDEQRHSRLVQINRDTVKKLEPAWSYELKTNRGVEATPLVHDGIIYVTGAWSIVYALDAKTGEELWIHDPVVPKEKAVDACCDVVNRGVALYGGKVFVGALDGRLQALDARTGKLVWSKQTVDPEKRYTITGAPRAAKGLIFVGNGGAEYGVRGYVSAYDADSGDLRWRFYTVPNPKKTVDNAASDPVFKKFANGSWGDKGAWQKSGGGGTVWDSIVYDHINDSLIFGVGNGSPWNAKLRDPSGDGDNLFLSSIVAVDAETGAYKWHFQTTPRDHWDYTATQSIILADLPTGADGNSRRVVMQAPKNGFYYVLDAATGEFISGAPFVNINWASALDESGRPIENPAARNTGEGALVVPGSTGAHNWHPMAFNPQTGLAYIPTQVIPLFYKDSGPDSAPRGKYAFDIGYDTVAGQPLSMDEETLNAIRSTNKGYLTAWNPTTQKLAWRLPLQVRDNSGILSTAGGLVFQGNSMGELRAYDAKDGAELWKYNIGNELIAAPMTYEIDGEQYLAVAAGAGGAYSLFAGIDKYESARHVPGRVLVFKLNGGVVLPEQTPLINVVKEPKGARFGNAALLKQGFEKYTMNCSFCHGFYAISGGVTPDLRWSPISGNADAWKQVVLEGALAERGMVAFADSLSEEDAEAIRAFVVDQAHQGADLKLNRPETD